MSDITYEQLDEFDHFIKEYDVIRSQDVQVVIDALRAERAAHRATQDEWDDLDAGAQELWDMAKHGYSAAGQIVALHDEILPVIKDQLPYDDLDEDDREMVEGYFSFAYKVATSYRKRFEAELEEQKRLDAEAKLARAGQGERTDND